MTDDQAHLIVNDVRLDLGPRCVAAMANMMELVWDGEAWHSPRWNFHPRDCRTHALALAAFKAAVKSKRPWAIELPNWHDLKADGDGTLPTYYSVWESYRVYQEVSLADSLGEGTSPEAAWAEACEGGGLVKVTESPMDCALCGEAGKVGEMFMCQACEEWVCENHENFIHFLSYCIKCRPLRKRPERAW